jgi:hypothetical protein
VDAQAPAEEQQPQVEPTRDLTSKKEAILAKLRGTPKAEPPPAQATAEEPEDGEPQQPVAAPAGEPAETEAETDTDGDDAEGDETATGRIGALTRELRDLRAKLDEATATAAGAEKAARDKLLARYKASPSSVFDDIEGLTLEGVSEDWLKRQADPARDERLAADKRIDETQAEIKKLREELAAKEDAAVESAARADGLAILTGETAAERWPIASRGDNASEAVQLAMESARKVGARLAAKAKAAGKAFTATAEMANKVFGECLDEVEKDFAARGKRYAAAAPKAGSKPQLVRGISGADGAAGGPRTLPPPKKLTREEILNRVRAGQKSAGS